MKAKLIKKSGLSAIIMYRNNDGFLNAAIIDSKDLPTERTSIEFEISDKILSTSTPYGVDWTVVFPDGIVIQPVDIQEVLYSNGIIAMIDIIHNTVAVISAINSLTRLTSARILKMIRETMEEQK